MPAGKHASQWRQRGEALSGLGSSQCTRWNANSVRFLEILEHHGLIAANSFRYNEPSFVFGSLDRVSFHIDHICVPRATLADGRCEPAWVDMKGAAALQLVDTCRPVDHRPVVITLAIDLVDGSLPCLLQANVGERMGIDKVRCRDAPPSADQRDAAHCASECCCCPLRSCGEMCCI